MQVTATRILIVEDETDLSRALEKHLRRLKYEVLGVARSDEEARRMAEAILPDLVLSDISILGGRDGIDLAEECWKQLDVPVIFLTGHADPETIERVRQSRSFGYLSKPFRAEELNAAIERALTQHGTERRLKRVEESSLAAIRSTSDAVVMAGIGGAIQFLNPAAERLLGVNSADAARRPLTEIIRFDDKNTCLDDVANLTTPVTHEPRIATADGRKVPVELTVSAIQDEHRGRIGTVVILRDITERKRFEAQLWISRAEYRALAAHLESVREAERTRIAREIHDELGQMLTGLKYDVVWLEKQLREKPEVSERLKEMTGQLQQTMDTVRRIAAELRPGVLDELGLAAAIEWQVKDFERRTGLLARVELNTGERPLAREAATALFRVLQEGLTNVARHARAKTVLVSLHEQARELVLAIEDDGRGISEPEVKRTGSFGLMGMRERVEALRGRCEIKGLPGRGTIVRVSVPLDAVLAPEQGSP